MDTQTSRRLIEMAYLYAWGPAGDADLRDEWHNLYRSANCGSMIYNGRYNGRTDFSWSDVSPR
jgi:hypothetical protein